MNLGEKLQTLVRQHGPGLLNEHTRVIGFLADWRADSPKQARQNHRDRWLVESAYQSGVAQSLLKSTGWRNRRRAIRHLRQAHNLAPAAALETVQALSLALGHAPKPNQGSWVWPLGLSKDLAWLGLMALGLAMVLLGWRQAEEKQAQALQQAQTDLAWLQAEQVAVGVQTESDIKRWEQTVAKDKQEAQQRQAEAERQRLQVLIPEMVAIPAGGFMMGSDAGDADAQPDEQPRHTVQVKAFKLGRYEVTQAQWQAVMGGNPSHFSSCGGGCPVESVSFDDAQAYIAKLNRQAGQRYRLPTEAEWEYACRAGGAGRYCGSDDVDAVAWHSGNSGNTTHPVGQKQKNAFGLHDMGGNVWEWTCSAYAERYDGGEKTCANDADRRAVRGGSWDIGPHNARSANRSGYDPAYRYGYFGFRLAQD